MNKEQLTEALKMLARGRLDAAETIAEMLCPEPAIVVVELSDALTEKA